MFNNTTSGSYIDEYGTKHTPVQITEDDKSVTEIINSSKTVATMEKQSEQLKRQNDLYEKEIKELRRTGTITMWAAIIAAAAAVLAAILPIILGCSS